MLINLSNHPSQNWSPEQLEAAKSQFGQVEDLPFPNIPPDATANAVLNLAKTYFDKIMTFGDNPLLQVHLMGEMTFTVALVRMLQNAQIRVVCSTTKRIILEEKEGLKTAKFQFIQFRDYP
jgi:hypothetical protein